MKRARPQGLGAASKKAAVEVASPSQEASTSNKLVFELPEDATALDQVKALYETALVSLEEPDRALSIFNGVVHECLRLEKIRDAEDTPNDLHPEDNDIDSFLQVKKDVEKIFGSEYFFVLGDSLRNIAELSMAEIEAESFENVKGLFMAAKEKLDVALSQADDEPFSEALSESACRTVLFVDVFEGKVVKLGSENIECFSDALEFMISCIEFLAESDKESKAFRELKKVSEEVTKLVECTEEVKPKIELAKIDLKLRLAIAEEVVLEDGHALVEKIDALMGEIEDSDLKFEALMLKGSILETSGKEEEAKAVYAEANIDSYSYDCE